MDAESVKSASEVWLVLWPVIVGGALTLAAGLLGQIVTHVLSTWNEAGKRKRQRFEELMSLIYDHDRWLDQLHENRIWKGDSSPPSSAPPLHRAFTIATIEFPEFLEDLTATEKASRGYEIWMWGPAQKKLAGELTGINEGFREAYTPYQQAREKLLKGLQDYAVKNLAGK